MTELSFLIDLLLNHDLPKVTKDSIAGRIKEVEQLLTATKFHLPATAQIQNVPPKLQQAASTLVAMARHGGEQVQFTPPPPAPEPIPLTGEEIQARNNSMEILKRKKQMK